MFNIIPDSNNRRAEIHILQTPQNAQNGVRFGLYKLGLFLKKDASDGIKKSPKTGKRYYYSGWERRGKSGFWTRSSQAGAYPANQTGRLRKSLGFQVIGQSRMEFGLRAKYGKWLEEGTRKMQARPALKLTVLGTIPEQLRIMQDSINRSLS